MLLDPPEFAFASKVGAWQPPSLRLTGRRVPQQGPAGGHPFRSCHTRVSPTGDTNDVITELCWTRLPHKNIPPRHARSVSPNRAADPFGAGGHVDTATPMRSMLFTIMAAIGKIERKIKLERVVDLIYKRRDAGSGPISPPSPRG